MYPVGLFSFLKKSRKDSKMILSRRKNVTRSYVNSNVGDDDSDDDDDDENDDVYEGSQNGKGTALGDAARSVVGKGS